MIDKKKYIIKPPKSESTRRSKTIHQSEIETALWKLGANYYNLTKQEEDLILKLANRF